MIREYIVVLTTGILLVVAADPSARLDFEVATALSRLIALKLQTRSFTFSFTPISVSLRNEPACLYLNTIIISSQNIT